MDSVLPNLPVVTLLSIIFYTGYAYLITHIFRMLQGDLAGGEFVEWRQRGMIQLCVFSYLGMTFLYCLGRSFFTLPGSIPETAAWAKTQESPGSAVEGVDLKERKLNGEYRYCKWCKRVKPDRAHHCSRCGRCILRMDHHCPWINNCIGHRNIKFFFLTIFYGLALTIFMTVTSIDTFLFYARLIDQENQAPALYTVRLGQMSWLTRIWIFSSMLCLTICLATLLAFYLAFISVNLFKNQTTLEFCEKSSKQRRQQAVDARALPIRWNVGLYGNIKQILGPHWFTWLVPVDYGRGDGLTFPTGRTLEEAQLLLNHT